MQIGGGFTRGAVLASLVLLAACGSSRPVDGEGAVGGVAGAACVEDDFCAGAAERVITPTQAQIDGLSEERLFLGNKTQKFNLGGYGLNPLQNLPDPFAPLGENLTVPAQERVHYAARTRDEENTTLRLLLLALGDTRVVFVTVDAIGAGNIIQQRLTQAIVDASCALDFCVPADAVLFGQTHTHAGADLQGLWGGVPQDWIDNTLLASAADAVSEAITARRRARLRVSQAETLDFNNYRRPRVDPAADADPHVTLLRIEQSGGRRTIAQLLQYNAHPTSIDEDPRVPHADYVYGAMRYLEQQHGGVALYYNGVIADASPSGGQCDFDEPDAYERVRCRGHDLAAFADAQSLRTLSPQLAHRAVTATLPVTNPLFVAAGGLGAFNRYYDFTATVLTEIPVLGDILGTTTAEIGQVATTATTLVSRVSIGGAGGLEIVTIPGETTNTFGQFIRRVAAYANPDATVMTLGLTHNSFGYIIPEEEFSYVDLTGETGFLIPFTGYEEFVSLGPLTAPLLRMQAYIPLFDAPATEYLPEYLRACADPASPDCLITDIANNLERIQSSYAQQCVDAGAPEALCTLLDPQTPLAGVCLGAGLPVAVCGLLGDGA